MSTDGPGLDPAAASLLATRLPEGGGRWLGVDAGGSASRVAVVEHGRVVSWSTTAAMNALLTPDVPDRLAGLALEVGADAVGVGMPGIRTDASAAALAADVRARCGVPVAVTTDAETARLGAFLGGPGVAVAAGTGSVAIGSDGARSARAGGHGFLLGDEGGAYWIGREAVRSMLAWYDGAGGSAALTDAVLAVVGPDPESFVRAVYAAPTDRSLLARLAPAVTALAASDPEAARIAGSAAGHLAALAEAITARLGPLPVAGLGGVLAAPAVWQPFAARCGARLPLAPPAVGAALLAAATAGAGAAR